MNICEGVNMKENLMLIFGGKSVEHDISIITALQTMREIKGYKILPVYVQRDGKWCTAENLDKVETFINFEKNVKKKREVTLNIGEQCLYFKKGKVFKKLSKIDVALMCLHGGEGEDGSIASLLSMCNIPYSSSSHSSSAICMDKIFTKDILTANKIDNVTYYSFSKLDYLSNEKSVLKEIKNLGYPVIIKPANLGSSVAIGVAKSEKELKEKIEVAIEFDERVLVEKFLKGCEEYNCACLTLDGKSFVSKVIRVDKGEIFSFEEKYIVESTKREKKIEKSIEKQIKTLTKQVYKVLNCSGVVRIDFLVTSENVYVNEVNTIPGSLSLHMFNGISKMEIIDALVKDAKDRSANKNAIISVFKSEALEIFKSAVELAKSRK